MYVCQIGAPTTNEIEAYNGSSVRQKIYLRIFGFVFMSVPDSCIGDRELTNDVYSKRKKLPLVLFAFPLT